MTADGRPLRGAHGRAVYDAELDRPRCTADSTTRRREHDLPPGDPQARCRNRPIPGAAICRAHGGAAPQVKRSARLRLLELVDPSLATLARVLAGVESDARVSDKLRAVENVLDRAGYPRRHEVDVEQARADLLERIGELRSRNGRGARA